MMYLYLIQHGEAKSKEEDPERGLTETGAADTRKSAVFFKKVLREQIPPSIVIWHSGKKRAEQTAHILAETIGGGAAVETKNGLAPNDDVAIIKDLLEQSDIHTIVLAGHLPHLSHLASNLLSGQKERGVVVHFKNSGIVCLYGENGYWHLEWMVTPGIL
jgi:phosphohistidine phosphatase